MNLRVGQIIEINKTPICYNGKGEDGQGLFFHYFTLNVPGKETTFCLRNISVATLSQALDKVLGSLRQSESRSFIHL